MEEIFFVSLCALLGLLSGFLGGLLGIGGGVVIVPVLSIYFDATGRFPADVSLLIAVATSGENHIVVAPGANRRLATDAVRNIDAAAAICQLEVPVPCVVEAARSFRGFFCVNLAPATEIDVTVLQRADLVVVNETESDWYGATLAACRGIVATTRGAGKATLERDGRIIAEATPPIVNVVDTTGAGDAFTAALTVALLEGRQPSDALVFACTAGSIAATMLGAQTSLPERAAVLGFR